MNNKIVQMKIKKMGKDRLVLYLPKSLRENIEFNFGEIVNLEIQKGNEKAISIFKFHYLISLKKEIVSSLNLKEKDAVNIIINKSVSSNNPLKMFKDGKIDLLFFTPEKTRKESDVFVEVIEKNSEVYLRLCSFHKRGSSSQIEIKRFIDTNLFGKFLGQIQAEGTKSFFDGLEFCNKSLHENLDFINFLEYLGIPSNKIFTKVDYHSNIKNIDDEIKKFQKIIGYKINYKSLNLKSRGGFGFKVIVRNTILSEIILNALNLLRTALVENRWDKNFNNFANGFFAKILNGDGSFEIITKNRNVPQARLIIYDGNLNYLEDYKIIMEKYGFIPKINEKWGYVRAYCNPLLAKKLLLIKAFQNNPNEKKLMFFLDSREKSSTK